MYKGTETEVFLFPKQRGEIVQSLKKRKKFPSLPFSRVVESDRSEFDPSVSLHDRY